MERLDKLTSERSKSFHRIDSLYVGLSTMQAGTPEYAKHLEEIAAIKLQVVKLQRQIVISRMKKAERYLAGV